MKITANSFVPTEAKIIIEGKSYTGNEFNKLVQALRPLSLNDNQQTVLEWLKKRYIGDADPFGVTASLFSQTPRSKVIVASLELTKVEQAQVLQAFASWALEQEEK